MFHLACDLGTFIIGGFFTKISLTAVRLLGILTHVVYFLFSSTSTQTLATYVRMYTWIGVLKCTCRERERERERSLHIHFAYDFLRRNFFLRSIRLSWRCMHVPCNEASVPSLE